MNKAIDSPFRIVCTCWNFMTDFPPLSALCVHTPPPIVHVFHPPTDLYISSSLSHGLLLLLQEFQRRRRALCELLQPPPDQPNQRSEITKYILLPSAPPTPLTHSLGPARKAKPRERRIFRCPGPQRERRGGPKKFFFKGRTKMRCAKLQA